jgi:hypothetical protein
MNDFNSGTLVTCSDQLHTPIASGSIAMKSPSREERLEAILPRCAGNVAGVPEIEGCRVPPSGLLAGADNPDALAVLHTDALSRLMCSEHLMREQVTRIARNNLSGGLPNAMASCV